MPKCPPTGGVRLQEVSVSGGSTVQLRGTQSFVETKLKLSSGPINDANDDAETNNYSKYTLSVKNLNKQTTDQL